MSKIGRVNLELTEEANELGYDSVGEAIADGWESNEVAATLTKKDELREAHEAWLKEREEVLEGLDYLLRGYVYEIEDAEKIVKAIEFIEKGEV